MTQPNQSPHLNKYTVTDYWVSSQGLDQRAEMLSKRAIYGFYNELVRVIAKEMGAEELEYTTMRDNKVRPEHAVLDGRRYKHGQYKPFIPNGIGCRCYWTPIWGHPPVGVV